MVSLRRVRVIEADAGIPGILCSEGHLPEGVFDDSRGVPSDPELEEEHSAAIGPVCLRNAVFREESCCLYPVNCKEIGVAAGGLVPAVILNERVIRAEVRGHLEAVIGAVRYEPGVNLHPGAPVLREKQLSVRSDGKALGEEHFPHHLLIVIGLSEGCAMRPAALEKAVVSLRVEEPLLVEASSLEAVIRNPAAVERPEPAPITIASDVRIALLRDSMLSGSLSVSAVLSCLVMVILLSCLGTCSLAAGRGGCVQLRMHSVSR